MKEGFYAWVSQTPPLTFTNAPAITTKVISTTLLTSPPILFLILNYINSKIYSLKYYFALLYSRSSEDGLTT